MNTFATIIIVSLFIIIVLLNSVSSLKINWAFFYDTQLFRKFFPYDEGFTIKHPQDNEDEPPDVFLNTYNTIFKNAKSSYSKGIETFSLTKGCKSCPDKRYTNCDGNLCLSTDDITLLKTRGGNDSTSANYN